MESVFLSRVEGRGFHVDGEGTVSRVPFFPFFYFFLINEEKLNRF